MSNWNDVLAKDTNGYAVKENNVDVKTFPESQGVAHSFRHNDGQGNQSWALVDYSYLSGSLPLLATPLTTRGDILTVDATPALVRLGKGATGTFPVWNATDLAVSKVVITQPATGATLTIADNKTFTVNNSLTLSGTDGGTLSLAVTNTKTLTLTATDNFNLTIPATGTAALLATANVFTTNQKINANSTTALLVEQTGVKSNVLVVDTINARVGVNVAPVQPVDLRGAYTTLNNGYLTTGMVNIVSTNTAAVDVGPSIHLGGETGNGTTPYAYATIRAAKASANVEDYSGYLEIRTTRGDGSSSNTAQVIKFVSGMLGINLSAPAFALHVGAPSSGTRGICSEDNTATIQPPLITFRKSRGSFGSPATVSNNDYVSNFSFSPYVSSSGYITPSGFGAIVNGTVTSTKAPVDIYFYNTPDGANTSNAYPTFATAVFTASGNIGFGTVSPSTRLHAIQIDATTNAVVNVFTLGKNVTSGNGADGLGVGQLFTLADTTTDNVSAARIYAQWQSGGGATHASRKADLVLTVFDTAEREGIRIRASGTAPMLGFLGVTPVTQQANTVALDTLLVNYGLRASGGYANFATTIQPRAGTTAANTSPLKFTTQASGLTVVEQGAMELIGNSLQFTQLAKRRGVAMTQNTRTTDFTLAASSGSSESAAVETSSHGANYLEVGKMEELVLVGTMSQRSNPNANVTIRVKYAGSTVITFATTTSTAIAANSSLLLRIFCTCRSTGASGTMQINAVLEINGNATDPQAAVLATIDTTTAQDTTVTFQWGTDTDAANTITINQARVLCVEPSK